MSEQTDEIGVRIALGAARSNVLGMILRCGLITTGAALVVGLPLYIPARRAMNIDPIVALRYE